MEVVVLAAGAGTRMRSAMPKVLHPLGGRPLLAHVLDTARHLDPSRIHVVVGEQSERVEACFKDYPGLSWALQETRQGTGHAVGKALPAVSEDATVLVLFGDAPFTTTATMVGCVEAAGTGIALACAELDDPFGFGRILRDGEGHVTGIVEERDASSEERALTEVNTGILAASKAVLRDLIASLRPDNDQGEYYLTDVVAMAVARGLPVTGVRAGAEESLGVNDRAQLAQLERIYQRREASRLMAEGVTLVDPARIDVRGSLRAGRDCVIDVNVVLEGDVSLGEGVHIGSGCVIRDSVIGDGVSVLPMSSIDCARVAAGCRIGPFARLRPGTELAESVHIGNFVETKQASLGAGAKANHLAYVGDASVGERTNIGAGAVTCNYDGVDKHRTEIGDDVFVGTNATLVAPVVIEDEAYIGAGSTITTRVRREDLAVGRGRQRNIQGWISPAKRKRRRDQGRVEERDQGRVGKREQGQGGE